jgi:hypothetical protein
LAPQVFLPLNVILGCKSQITYRQRKNDYHQSNYEDLRRRRLQSSLRQVIQERVHLYQCFLVFNVFLSGFRGEEAGMADVFIKARESAPCAIILEDLDSLITDQNRSFFLNQLDGLEGNDGLLVIGTTNHLDKLDPGLSTRPSRFDRK